MANAAMDLGATPFQALTKVIVPMIKEGIFAGALLAFTMSFDDFVISYFVSGNGVKNISIVVYNMTKRINPTINALSTIVIVVIIVVLLLANLLPKFKNKARKLNRKAVKIVSVVLVVAVTEADQMGIRGTVHSCAESLQCRRVHGSFSAGGFRKRV